MNRPVRPQLATGAFVLPRLAIVGLVIMFLSCVLFGLSAAVTSSDAAPAFALFCLFPIGVITMVAGFASVARKRSKDDQRRG